MSTQLPAYTERAIARCVGDHPKQFTAVIIGSQVRRALKSTHMTKRGRRFAKLVKLMTHNEWQPTPLYRRDDSPTP